jgi:transcriptional regulator with XRE-family HTH domain
MDSVGQLLKEKRLEKGLVLDDVADAMKIRKKYIEALENGNYSEIPDKVYTKSFLKIYADFLGLDRVYILKRYMDEVIQEDIIIAPQSLDQKSFGNVNIAKEKSRFNLLVGLIIGLLILALIIWGIFSLSKKENNPGNVSNNIENQTLTIPESPAIVPIENNEVQTNHQFDKLVIHLKAFDKVWLGINADSKDLPSFTLKKDEEKTLEANKTLNLTIGKPYALALTINGFEISSKIRNRKNVVEIKAMLSPNELVQIVINENGIQSEPIILKE